MIQIHIKSLTYKMLVPLKMLQLITNLLMLYLVYHLSIVVLILLLTLYLIIIACHYSQLHAIALTSLVLDLEQEALLHTRLVMLVIIFHLLWLILCSLSCLMTKLYSLINLAVNTCYVVEVIMIKDIWDRIKV